MKTITLTCQKGGVGKSTTAESLINSLRQKGYKVLAMDLDQSANLTSYFIGDDYEFDAFDLVTGKRDCSEVIKNDIIPGGNGLVYLPQFFETNDYAIFKEKLKDVSDNYDFFVIDTPPTASKVILAALAISDYVIIPAEPSMDCIDGSLNTIDVINLVQKRYNPDLVNLGILFIKFKERFSAHTQIRNLLKAQNIEAFDTVIRESQAINNAKLLHEDFMSKEYKNVNAVIDYQAFVKEFLSKIK